MKFCPYCGADLVKEDAAFCVSCGKRLSVSEDPKQPSSICPEPPPAPAASKRKRKKRKPAKKPAPPPASDTEAAPEEDSYDGYYDDVLPPDLDRVKEGVDQELVKKLAILAISFVLIISLCVFMIYLL